MSKSLSDGFKRGFHTKFANVLLYFPRERVWQPRNISVRSNVFGNLNSNFKATTKTSTTFFFQGGGSTIERYREDCNAYYNFLGMSAAGKKRKLGDGDEEQGKKWYAVKAGHTPGVYESYKECQRMTTGFKGANFKSFTSRKDAEDYCAGKVVATKPDPGKPIPYYGVAVGHKPGVYTNWDEARPQVENIKGPKYKRFDTRAEAEEFVRSGGKSSTVAASKEKRKAETSNEPAAKRNKTSTASNKRILQVYTDGSSRGNGKVGAVAGVGVYFGEDDPRNVAEPLEGEPQTNNRAELTGILRALQIVSKDMDRDMEILTDSNYSINCCTVWFSSWIKKGWKTSTGKPVENKDLIEQILAELDKRARAGVKTTFTWVQGHANDYGNEAADKLANIGTDKNIARKLRGL